MKVRFLFFILVASFFVYSIHVFTVHADDLSNAQADRSKLEMELANLEQEIAAKQRELDGQKGQSKTLSGDIKILITQINKAKLDINAKNLTIKKLGGEIVQKNKKIQTLTEKIESEKQTLGQLVRKSREIDDKSTVNFILSGKSISDVYGDIDNFLALKDSIGKSVGIINTTRVETETEKKTLEIEKNQQTDVKMALENTKKQVELNEKNKQQLLSISKNKEAEYQKVLAEKAKRRNDIMNALFNLRDTGAIKFGDALRYAQSAYKSTNVKPAFVLAIITQESNLGTDQGSCYVTDMTTGSGVSSKSGKFFPNVMKPSRDIGPFFDIAQKAGRDPYKTLVSCPIASAGKSSWGGAMGPAQFIPSTWVGINSRVAKALGISNPDPWNAPDAIMASAVFLADLGAGGDSYTSQIRAACKYYGSGGSTCAYGRQVMARVSRIQANIDLLQN
ncbi:MAG: lytic murein transglycosylase [Candidatus Nomurabacteria bacterium]|nr:lytic murein transglycosylase [Candidatus Nomurabacteria bacterium]